MRKVFWLRLIAGLGCSGSAVLVVILCVAAVVVAKMQEDPLGILPACAPANPAGPDLLSNAPKPSPSKTGPSTLPAAYTMASGAVPLDAGVVRNVALARGSSANTIPSNYLKFYKAASADPRFGGIPWYVLAGIGKVETDHGRSTLPGVHSGENYAGAGGPMQFLQGTWNAYAIDGPGADGKPNGTKSRYDPADAIFTAANYLHKSGAPSNTRKAIYAYNHSWSYVDLVLSWAKKYGGNNFSLDGSNNAGMACSGGFGEGGSYAPGSVCRDAAGFVAGHITKRMACVRDQIKTKFKVPRGIGCYRADGGIAGGGEHPLGRACDFMISSGAPRSDEVQLGYSIANWAKANAARLGIDYIIYRQHIWNPSRAREGWRQMPDRGGLTANHYDHVHISVLAGDKFNA